MSELIVTHDSPGDANFLIAADLAPHGVPGRSEQLWTRRTGERTFVMRSLPYFVYSGGDP
jgi:hypothetical protein